MIHTNPGAVMRARALLDAWHRGDLEHMRDVIAEQHRSPEAGLRSFVALLNMADALTEYATHPADHHHAPDRQALLDELVRVQLAACEQAPGD